MLSTTRPAYITSTLLQKGLTDFSVAAGNMRRDYTLRDFGYGPGVTSGSLRYGVSDSFTLESHAEAGAGLRQAGIGATVGLGLMGTLTSSVSQSSGIGNGQQCRREASCHVASSSRPRFRA